jgi:photosystem II stability/assembly factor-like uncharacterized protein
MILIGTDEGVYRWIAGCGWPIFHSLQDRSIVGLAVGGGGVYAALDRRGAVLESRDGGTTWRQLPLPEGAGQPSALALAGTPPAIVVGFKPVGIFGRPVGAPIPRAPQPRPAPQGPLLGSLLERTRGLAEGATALLAPKKAAPVADPLTIKRAGWTPMTAPSAPGETTAADIRLLAVVPGELEAWFASVAGSGLWKSGDGGQSWARCQGPTSEVYALRPVPGRPGHLWAATGDGCWQSTDGGTTWADRSAGLDQARHVRAIDIKPDAPDVLLAGAASAAPAESGPAPREAHQFALYESTSGGKTWTQVVKRTFPEAIDDDIIADVRFDPAAPDCIVVALGSGELWSTSNAGAYWAPLARQIQAARVLCGLA